MAGGGLREGLMWKLPARPDVAAELAAAGERFRARTGRRATTVEVHPERAAEFAGLGLAVVEDPRIRRGEFRLGRAEGEGRRRA